MKKRPNIGIITGFAKTEGIEDFQEQLHAKISPRSCTLIESVPLHKAACHPEQIVSEVSNQIDALLADCEDPVLVGHSYGALIAFVSVCGAISDLRRRLSQVSHLFLVDGPLRSDVDVPPVKGMYKAFQPHYDYRPQLAQQWESAFDELDSSKIIAVGSSTDFLVPPEAKFPLGLEKIELESDEELENRQLQSLYGCNVVLPPHYKGHSIRGRTAIVSSIMERFLSNEKSYSYDDVQYG